MTAVSDIERDRLQAAALPHVPFDGWTMTALEAGARDVGEAAESFVRTVFPGGVRDAVAHFSGWADRHMVAAYESRDTGDYRFHEKVALAVELRLAALQPHREAVRRGLPWLSLPANAALGARLLYRTVDEVWYTVGDRSADFSFYTKRALLAGVVASATLYWLDDASDGMADTCAFIRRRIDDVMRIHRARASLGGLAGADGRSPANPLRILRQAISERYFPRPPPEERSS